MKKVTLFIYCLFANGLFAQEHFSGIATSKRTGLLNADLNPAELVNLQNTYEVNIFNFSAGVANNKITFADLLHSDNDFEEMIFSGNEAANLSADVAILGPAFGFKKDKWGFAISTGAHVKANFIDINTTLGRAVTNGGIDNITQVYPILQSENQRVVGTSWGEIGFSAAREFYQDNQHKLSAGLTFKLLFPNTYANMGAGKLNGTIVNDLGNVYLTDAQAEVNFAYSGPLADDYSDSGSFTEFFAGGLNGFCADLGINYQLKDNNQDGYRVNAGISFKNLGNLTFKDDNNTTNNYSLNIPEGQYFNLNQFEGVESVEEIEDIFVSSGFATIQKSQQDFKVKLPSYLSVYADIKIHRRWYATALVQQKTGDSNNNNQITVPNIYSVTPRYSSGFFEAYMPLASNEISGFTAGIGFRLGGFFIGSSSLLSATVTDTDQADAYIGFRVGF
ncbi:hypothetical protein [Flavobacterium rhizosphaerae]|uniref:DUF5723 domain-containing protein n=1 Tax=Flavobacterium rhizosphaerae TaxID=3163298 RepID=A0ABW8YSK3_9FLAO